MSKRKRSKQLKVRVEYEPNRFSQDCLQQVYGHFSPTASVSLSRGSKLAKATDGVEVDADAAQTPGDLQ